jgi:hypothetical protein
LSKKLKLNLAQWEKDAQARRDCEEALQTHKPGAKLPGAPAIVIDFYPIVISFDTLEDAAERHYFKSLPHVLPPSSGNRRTTARLGCQASQRVPGFSETAERRKVASTGSDGQEGKAHKGIKF